MASVARARAPPRAIATTARVPRRGARAVRRATTSKGGTKTSASSPKGSKGRGGSTKNLINYVPKPDAPEPWWPVDERTGKPPGWFQFVVFAGSQLFIGVVMQPAALVYQSLFDPIVGK